MTKLTCLWNPTVSKIQLVHTRSVNTHGEETERIQRQEEAPNANNAIIDLVVLQSFVVLKFVAMSCTVVY